MTMILEEKIELARNYLHQALSMTAPGRIAVAWTGGKDSTVALALWREVLGGGNESTQPARALNLDTGLKFPEIIEFRDRISAMWGVALSIVRPGVELTDYPVAEDPVQCCRDLKILPLHKAIADLDIKLLITGLRADEHSDRFSRSWKEQRNNPDYTMLNPLIHWTEMDIWAFTLQSGLPYCALYDHGYRSLGCKPCTSSPGRTERSGRNKVKEDKLHILHSLGYF
ncbi:MAG: phosphoadenosine phosphosulfate reductase family protein [Desulfovermiculus sp.]